MDSTSSFVNYKLDKESRRLTTFRTPFGRYHYLRMPMGASLSSDVYQYKVDSHLEVIKQCVAITDDIIIYGYDNDGTDHDKMVREVMRKAQEVGMHFNPSKCQFRKTEVEFFGMNVEQTGCSEETRCSPRPC